MKPLIIEPTEDTPMIYFHPQEGRFEISKSSLPENAVEFYNPIIQWLKAYSASPNPQTVFDFNLEYLNTASSKQVFEIVMQINNISHNSDVTVRWHYDSIDEDMLGLGTRFSHLVNVNFEFVEYDSDDALDFE